MKISDCRVDNVSEGVNQEAQGGGKDIVEKTRDFTQDP